MKLIFIGPQGSGKGTQAKIISKKLGILHVSTGDLIRNNKGELKKEVDSYINKGNLIPDSLMLKILKGRLNRMDCKKGFILDGYPRNIKQSGELDQITGIDKIIEIKISDEESVRRLSGRRSCKKCGKIYNLETAPKPKKNNLCDDCNIKLFQRKDDSPEAIKKRLEIYHEDTEPVLEKYDSVKINGEQNIEKVTKDVLNALN